MAALITVTDTATQEKFDEITRRIDVLRTQFPTVAFETVTNGDLVSSVTIKVPQADITPKQLQAAFDAA
jgi:hypothetical protein